MNRKEVIREFRQKADAAGKPFSTQNGRRGVKLVCGKQSVLLPPHNRDVFNVRLLEKRLGLNQSALTRA